MASKVESIKSVLTTEEMEKIIFQYKIPSSYLRSIPKETDRADSPPTGYITVYEAHLKSGLRFPLASELQTIFSDLGVSIARYHANAVRYLCNLCIFFRLRGTTLNTSIVRALFKFCQNGDWISLSPRDLNISGVIIDTVKNWKDRFFFLAVPQSGISNAWGKIPESLSGKPSPEEEESVKLLIKMIKSNMESFSDKGRLFTPEIFALTKWGSLTDKAGTSEPTPKKLKRKAKDTAPQGVNVWLFHPANLLLLILLRLVSL
ncbi:hypothetical protein Nepgr_009554 [Nepenthes gracilis]|uniref:Uncharacterized protein n=1 Tax=Nepenthes gracilis TaxID=150966 RepID=A0AAD3SBI7_NEPGR|nr:hypothetical protein Nepgr_009554 [Nepenthes gracilis]